MSVYAAVTASNVREPAEKSLLSHVQFVRGLLDQGTVRALIWLDTRDMIADGMTKGAVNRAAIENCMNGKIEIKHELKRWEPLVRKPVESYYIAIPSLNDGSSEFVLLGNRAGTTTRFPLGDQLDMCNVYQKRPSVRMPTESRSRFLLYIYATTLHHIHNVTLKDILGRWGLFNLFSYIGLTNLTAVVCNFSTTVRGTAAQALSNISEQAVYACIWLHVLVRLPVSYTHLTLPTKA